ncbi:VOC family protein [Amycolatopsis palatopharyngis]|uniref:VOC family protein n=1 Tax=Amycolatopsis palatopharyngis TaxID=187982 RepID=UPI000E24A037|nr:VOC family protein [Amycolatopsis palatopharyngis]
MQSRILAVVLDCRRSREQATFWCAALGYEVLRRWQDADGLTYVELGAAGRTMLLLQPVPEEKRVKNRLHLDLVPADGGQYDEVERLVGLGATVLSDESRHPWVLLADPEGNEFCVLPPR